MNTPKPHSRISRYLRFFGTCLLILPAAGTSGRAHTVPQTPSGSTQKRAPHNLNTLMERANWDVTQRGPLLALNPFGVDRNAGIPLPDAGPSGYELRLAAPSFNRMLVNCGTVSILAPTQMTLIEDKPRERPNLYDGLPRELKVKYLMATLTPQQWKTLGEKGLGASDLTGEQQPVFLSLLPDPFVVKRWTRDANGVVSGDSSLVTLAPEERAQVRLRVHRSAQIMAPLQDKPNTYTSPSLPEERPGEPNGAKWERDRGNDDKKTDLFGVNLSSVVPNKSKPSQLDYASPRLNAPVALQGAVTLGDLVARIGEVTHLELYADGRIARLPLLVRGNRTRSGDALKALALAVTGTFRKVDTAYILTSDLTGIGTRQMRLAEWQWQIKEQTQQLEKELTKQILQHSGKEGGVLALGYAPNDPYALTPDIEKAARKDRFVSATNLTPAVQQLLHDAAAYQAKNPNAQQLRDDSAMIDILWRFAFQLPNGAILQSESGLAGYAAEYYPTPSTAYDEDAAFAAMNLLPVVRRPLPARTTARTLFLTPRNGQDAQEMAQVARRLGFTELILQTEDPSVIKAAIAQVGKTPVKPGSGAQRLRICAAVAPFSTAPADAADAGSLDLNLMGETPAQIVVARKAQPRWNRFLQRAVEHSGGFVASERMTGMDSALVPTSSACEAHFRKIAELARTAGLAGLFLYDTQPGGYAGARPTSFSTNDEVLAERENLGYASALRLAFLRKAGADPLDLIPPRIDVDINLELPFFLDFVASVATARSREAQFTPEKGEAWDAFRAEVNRKSMSNLFAFLRAAAPNLPLLLESRSPLNNIADAARFLPAWAGWTQAETLFIGTSAFQDSSKRPQATKDRRYLFPMQFSNSEKMPARLLMRAAMEQIQLTGALPNGDTTLAFDLRYLPASRALSLLNEFIAPANP